MRFAEAFFSLPDFFIVTVDRARISDLGISDVTTGIIVRGGIITGCQVEAANVGIDAEGGSVEGCEATTTLNGPAVRVIGGRVVDCVAVVGPGAEGFAEAFEVGDSAVRGCTTRLGGVGSVGFRFGSGASVTNCVANETSGASGNSIGFNGDGVITGCVARDVFIGYAMNEGVLKGSAAINCTNDTDITAMVTDVDNGF